MTCETVQTKLCALTDGELSPFSARRVRRHLDACPACAAELAAIQMLTTQARTLPERLPLPTLESRIAVALPLAVPSKPTPKLRWQSALAAAVAGAAALAAVLFLPGSPAHPLPAFADVESAMQSVQSISALSIVERQLLNGKTTRQATQCWTRRHPPTQAFQVKETGERMLDDGKHFVTYSPKTGKWNIRIRHWNIAEEVEQTFFAYTHPTVENTSPGLHINYFEKSVWQSSQTELDGKSVWKFTSTMHPKTYYVKDMDMRKVTIWADAQTHRVVRTEIVIPEDTYKYRNIVSNYRYNEPAPPGVFDLKPPKGTPTTKRKW